MDSQIILEELVMLTVTKAQTQTRKMLQHIKVRRPKLYPERIPRYYFGNSPITSHLLSALSVTFPVGEQFFVHSVRNVRDRVKDNESLQAEISAFIGQEAMHSHAHHDFNQSWRRDDYHLDGLQQWISKEDQRLKKFPPKVQLALTCAVEHYTAILGKYILEHPDLVGTFDQESARLWLWHAVEELEHRSVAFDVYQNVYNDLETRKKVMRLLTPGFINMIAYATARLFWQDRKQSLPQVKANLAGLYRLTRMLLTLIPEYLSYYRADFHPGQLDVTDLLNTWRAKLGHHPYSIEGFKEVSQVV